ncbi:MAG TPA: CBS domain-containing protein [Saprospiraceae bacterium]|nr:CBS domain-containing protein [Saprospiraceae bacterium]HRX29159.1 CBS domain-containing protein [Saprospiraceae bacterium]
MKQRTPVSTIMTESPFTVNLNNSLKDVSKIFSENHIHHLPVVSGDKLLGIITKNDMERITYVSSVADGMVKTAVYDMLDIGQVMTEQVESIEESDTIKDAAELLSQGTFHALPVTKKGKLTGIVTSTDIIKYLLNQYN